MEASELHDRLRSSVVDLLWDQWVALGLAGHAGGRSVPFVVDPEALLLTTLRLAMDEGRFRDEVLDWLGRNGSLLSVQRIKNLDRAIRVAPPERLRGLAAFMEKAGHPNWKTVGARVGTTGVTDFTSSVLRGMSRPPDPVRPEAFVLRLRQLFGVNARAEVLTWLFTHDEGHAARIAGETGWFSKSVQAILNDLEQAGTLVSRIDGKRRDYAMSRRSSVWHPDFGRDLRWFTQGMFYTGVVHVLHTLQAVPERGMSPEARAIAIRRQLAPLETAFRLAGLPSLFAGTHRERGDALVEAFEAGTNRLIRTLETRSGLGKTSAGTGGMA